MNKFFLIITGILVTLTISAQDPQFSQFYSHNLYLNPAFTGSHHMGRIGVIYRSQWPSINATFESYSAYFDGYIEKYYSSVGLMIQRDREGLSGLTSTSINALYSYELYLNDNLVFRPGVDIGYVIRGVNFTELTFGDQFDQNGFISQESAESLNTGNNVNYFDLGLGGLLYSSSFFVGFSAHHLTTPDQSILGDETSRLPIKMSVHGGYVLPFANNRSGRERNITPTFQYKRQGNFQQLDIGTYATLEPLVLGVWYRGLPIEGDGGINLTESIVGLVGLMPNENLRIGYSFDFTMSKVGLDAGGAHEITINYLFKMRDHPYRPPRSVMSVPCPNF
ncbi:type IX secretion system membrane protein PorP/SprF [Mangrovivirga sp. M17]|uniref:Type IX secretion system membrane protein PorP/SprF n=1 Tax=Mangrovivirga halotolerans TaxID=2993936 RepID=A0ABT3RPZ3_9BACT|nr:type IX secretion system membrane protein PorP/SprF [Mangrovivirga halotolerans]MCX2743439.1 type IX secretion system membrane protein PorP/SprF [Mangrovivirga halotolerans]